MADSSDVRSIDALRDLQASLLALSERWDGSLQQIKFTMHRVEEHFKHKMPTYWTQQLRLAEQKLTEAQDNLSRLRVQRVPIMLRRPRKRNNESISVDDICRYVRPSCEPLVRWPPKWTESLTIYQGPSPRGLNMCRSRCPVQLANLPSSSKCLTNTTTDLVSN